MPTVGRLTMALAAAVVAVGAGAWLPVLAGQHGSPPSAEAWYRMAADAGDEGPEQPVLDAACELGLPVPACTVVDDMAPPPSAYPEHTLHVSVTAGTPETMTVLELATDLPGDAQLTGGTLVLPVADDAGTVAPESANFQACLVPGRVVDGVENGDPATAPAVDCSASSPAVWVAPDTGSTPLPEQDPGLFTVDLAPFAGRWGTTTPAVALVPSDAAAEGSDTWHVAFHGSDRDGDGLERIAVTHTIDERVSDGPAGDPGKPSAAPVVPPSPPPTPTMPVDPPPAPVAAAPPRVEVPASSPTPVDPPVIAAPQPPPPPAMQPVMGTAAFPVGLIYPGVYVVPLVAVILAGLVGTSLARPLRLAVED